MINSLANINPEIAEIWHPTKNGDLTPSIIARASRYKAWWVCENGHEWQAQVYNITKRKVKTGRTRCPFCLGRRKGSLQSLYPDVSAEWNQDRNSDSPDNFLHQSHKKVWWICGKGHEWQARIQNRTVGGQGCPFCAAGYKTSRYEIRVYSEIKSLFSDSKQREIVCGQEVDVFIPSLRVAIEVDGSYWHRDKIKRDIEKNRILKYHGVSVIRLRQKPLGRIEDCDVTFGKRGDGLGDAIRLLLGRIEDLGDDEKCLSVKEYIQKDKFVNEVLYQELVSKMSVVDTEQSLSFVYPEDACQWNHERNGSLLPSDVFKKSALRVWWRCDKGHEWKASVSDKTRKAGKGCPFCASKIVTPERSLLFICPEVAAQWDDIKNDQLRPSDVMAASHKKVWWVCRYGHSWIATIKNRVANRTGCPSCFKNRMDRRNKCKR